MDEWMDEWMNGWFTKKEQRDLTAIIFIGSVRAVIFSPVATLRQFNAGPIATSPL
jgi:hypothetical protein